MPTPTPTPVPAAEVVRQAGEIVSIWNTLTPIMAVLFLALVSLGIVALVIWIGRNSNTAAINILTKVNAQKDQEHIDLKEEQRQSRADFIKGLTVIAEQSTRANDISEAINNRGLERDKQQQRLVETQARLADRFDDMLKEGSKPVQEIQTKVTEILAIATTLHTRTADWNGILTAITPLLVELGALRQEAKKHSTQPIPAVDPDPKPEASPT